MYTIKEKIKKLPGISLLHSFFKENPGSWIFSEKNINWIHNKKNFEKLPLLFKVFSIYCRFTPKNNRKVYGAETAHLFLSSLTRLLKLKQVIHIQIEEFIVYINLTDPRSLLIPNEIKNSAEIAVLKEYLSTGDTFIDIGANHGSFSIVASKLVGNNGQIIAIEPQPELASAIDQSLRSNDYAPFIIFKVACSDRNGKEIFYVPKSTSGSAGLFKKFSATSPANKLEVELIKFDELVNKIKFKGKVFIKLDIEGSEVNFLKGAKSTLDKYKPNIMIEINPYAMKAAKTNIIDFILLLENMGYSEYREIDSPKKYPLSLLNDANQKNIIIFPK